MKQDIKERFMSKISIGSDTDCWLWQGSFDSKGYGQFRVNYKMLRSHRFMWELIHGNIPDNINVLHRCDNPKCVNFNHLFLGTQKDNIYDCVKKDRAKGRYKRKFTKQQTKEIRELHSIGISYSKVAKMYGVSSQTICNIIKDSSYVTIDRGN